MITRQDQASKWAEQCFKREQIVASGKVVGESLTSYCIDKDCPDARCNDHSHYPEGYMPHVCDHFPGKTPDEIEEILTAKDLEVLAGEARTHEDHFWDFESLATCEGALEDLQEEHKARDLPAEGGATPISDAAVEACVGFYRAEESPTYCRENPLGDQGDPLLDSPKLALAEGLRAQGKTTDEIAEALDEVDRAEYELLLQNKNMGSATEMNDVRLDQQKTALKQAAKDAGKMPPRGLLAVKDAAFVMGIKRPEQTGGPTVRDATPRCQPLTKANVWLPGNTPPEEMKYTLPEEDDPE